MLTGGDQILFIHLELPIEFRPCPQVMRQNLARKYSACRKWWSRFNTETLFLKALEKGFLKYGFPSFLKNDSNGAYDVKKTLKQNIALTVFEIMKNCVQFLLVIILLLLVQRKTRMFS